MNQLPEGVRSPARGWRIERVPGRPLYATEDGMFSLPLWLVRDGRHMADAELVMSPAEAEHLHASLCRALDGHPPPAHAPDCRLPLGRSTLPTA